jgi:EAL domain-containing protein (putative c-di-GMP-specific phosphodiesterase class I)
MGRDLGIEVIAEGVETDPQVAALANQGCHLMQGYYFGKPVPLTEIVADLAVRDLRSNDVASAEDESPTSLKISGL